MSKKNKIILVVISVCSLFLVWYLLIKKEDYCISFTVKTATGTVFQGLQEWKSVETLTSNEKYTILEKRNFDFIKYELSGKNIKMDYSWKISSINDSITKVEVGIKDYNNSIYNRISVPFFDTPFKLEQIKKISDFKEGLIEHLKNFTLSVDGEGTSEEVFVAYISLKSVMQQKAQSMIANNADITGFLISNGIKIIGKPYVQITKWDLDKETIDFDYCFPVDKNVKIVQNKFVKFKKLPAIKGLTATYYGNYRTSDRAWFALIDYANNHGYKLNKMPRENFLANPFNGGDEMEWETKIIIPYAIK
ncbi:effector-binding domain-containing protein [Flavobacterium sp. PL11]|uniref:GyrI-like domain-containing protein n=1 Tax=Flavobacterium sp. PL11 TaxID=3071717 RepID=UPI002DF88263|nr:effector-binding domain-containing protein [Flavobacterium sp. PL11]